MHACILRGACAPPAARLPHAQQLHLSVQEVVEVYPCHMCSGEYACIPRGAMCRLPRAQRLPLSVQEVVEVHPCHMCSGEHAH